MDVLRRLGGLLALALLLTARAAPAQVALPTANAQVTAGAAAPLVVWNRPIIELRASIGGTTAEERVARARRRIEELPVSAYADPIQAIPSTVGTVEGVFVSVGSQLVFAILPEDLEPESGQTLESAGQTAVAQLTAALQARADQRRAPVIIQGLSLSVLATLLLLLALRLIGKFRRRAQERPITTKISGRAKIFGVDLGQALTAIERGLSKLTALGAMIVALYIWLTFVLGQFPFTQPWGRQLGQHLSQLLLKFGTGILGAMPGLFAVLLIFLLARLTVRAISGFFQSVESGQIELDWLEPETARATRQLVVVLAWSFAIIVAYPYIPGSASPVFKGVSVFLGVMATFGSAGVVNHLVSGLVIVYSRSCKPGDVIRAGEIEGLVTVVGVLSTKIVTRKREEITVPNAVLVGTSITNYTRLAREHGAMISTTVTIGYDAPWRQVHELLIRAADRTPDIKKTPAPFVYQRSLSDFYVEYELRAHITDPAERLPILSALHAEIQDAFNEAGVQIMSPHFETQPDGKVWVPRSAWRGLPPEAS
ncbi:MAG TPA: mechanosensitive ion channel [Gemmatimonadales bacterium]|nr:mechanosensitive ion channel [Gemmatimonadales bacterium]